MYIKGIFFFFLFFFYSLILLKVLSIGHFLVEDISRHDELSSMNLAGPTNQELPNLYSFRFRYVFQLPTFIYLAKSSFSTVCSDPFLGLFPPYLF